MWVDSDITRDQTCAALEEATMMLGVVDVPSLETLRFKIFVPEDG